jgi:hypothetical protein
MDTWVWQIEVGGEVNKPVHWRREAAKVVGWVVGEEGD